MIVILYKHTIVRCKMINKKADLSMNMIILAAISLLVLAIIAYLIFGASGNVTKGTGCEGIGGRCVIGSCSQNTEGYTIPNPALDNSCKKDGKDHCCIRIGSDSDNS